MGFEWCPHTVCFPPNFHHSPSVVLQWTKHNRESPLSQAVVYMIRKDWNWVMGLKVMTRKLKCNKHWPGPFVLILDDHMNPILSREDCCCMTTLKDHFPRRILLQVHTQEKCVRARGGAKFTRAMRQAQLNKIIKSLSFFFSFFSCNFWENN